MCKKIFLMVLGKFQLSSKCGKMNIEISGFPCAVFVFVFNLIINATYPTRLFCKRFRYVYNARKRFCFQTVS